MASLTAHGLWPNLLPGIYIAVSKKEEEEKEGEGEVEGTGAGARLISHSLGNLSHIVSFGMLDIYEARARVLLCCVTSCLPPAPLPACLQLTPEIYN